MIEEFLKLIENKMERNFDLNEKEIHLIEVMSEETKRGNFFMVDVCDLDDLGRTWSFVVDRQGTEAMEIDLWPGRRTTGTRPCRTCLSNCSEIK